MKNRIDIRGEIFIVATLVILWASLSAYCPRDTDYDVAHYHVYIGWAATEGRLDKDWAPANLHSFFNPYFQALFWNMQSLLPGQAVAFILGLIHGLQIPAIYLLTRRIWSIFDFRCTLCLILVTLIGFLNAANAGLLSSIRADHMGATAFMLAMWFIFRKYPKCNQIDVIFAGLILGLTFGLKATYGSYVIAIGVCLLLLQIEIRSGFRNLALLALSGFVGTIITGGVWFAKLWAKFGNPVFPYLSSVFPSDLSDPNVDTYDKWSPQNFWEILIDPFTATFAPLSTNERAFNDYRALIGYIAAIILIILLVLSRTEKGPPKLSSHDKKRALLSISITYLVLFTVWSMYFSVMRYGIALWSLGVPMASIIFILYHHKLNSMSRKLILGLCGFLVLATTEPSLHKRTPWQSFDEPYVWTKLPQNLEFENSIVIFAGHETATFPAPFFPKSAIFAQLAPQDYTAPVLKKYREKIVPKMRAHGGPYYVVFGQSDRLDETISVLSKQHQLSVNKERCEPLETSFDSIATSFIVCRAAF